MTDRNFLRCARAAACLCALVFAPGASAQKSDAIHEIEVYLRARGDSVAGVRVRLVTQRGMIPVADTYSGREGQLRFRGLLPGEYIVETTESDQFEATVTRVTIHPIELIKPEPMRETVRVDLPPRRRPEQPAPGVVPADVDLKVPEAALKHYRKGMDYLRAGDRDDATQEFKAAVKAHPQYYAARLELGRQLFARHDFGEAAEAFKPLGEIAPKRAEPRLEYAIVLLALRRPGDAAAQLRRALELEEANWATHLHLGWALLEAEPAEAERHFKRAIELDERKAAQAHLSLARLAYGRGSRPEAIGHLEIYLTLAPDAPDAQAVRRLLKQLQKKSDE